MTHAPRDHLPPDLARHLGSLLGRDLSAVRLQKCRGVFAATHGTTVYLSPAACADLHVVAHEVAHVGQQLCGAVRLAAGGPARPRLEPRLERDADAFADRAGRRGGPPLDPPPGEPTGEYLPYPIVKGANRLPTDAKGWLGRFNRFGRQERELPRVLQYMEEQQLEFDSEKDLVYLVRMVVEKLRRPRLGGNPVTVGIPYRDDGRGKAIAADVELVRLGTMCNVIVLVPEMFAGKAGMLRVKELSEAGITAVVAKPGCSLVRLNIHALYVSGGPHDHPQTTGEGRPREPGPRAKEAQERHKFETALILLAAEENIPVLGVCGGSWRLAATMGGKIERLEGKAEKTHAGPMTEPEKPRHEVTIQPASMLNAILCTDNYRKAWPTSDTPTGELKGLPVNSVHWAHSTFPMLGDVRVSATESGTTVTEAFESKSRHFQIGIQWHPEYAQKGMVGKSAIVGEVHRRILAALGDAATDGQAARVLQRAFRRQQLLKKASTEGGVK
jgi:gamma-glutamyl-gamma-aminobutyrate hydrolase PuuD